MKHENTAPKWRENGILVEIFQYEMRFGPLGIFTIKKGHFSGDFQYETLVLGPLVQKKGILVEIFNMKQLF